MSIKCMALMGLILSMFSFNSWSRPVVATVVLLRGEVTQLVPGSRIARKVQKGDQLQEDTSIVTSDKSFVRIKFSDETILNIGARSKAIVVQAGGKSPGIITLLKGRLRAKVNKSKHKKGRHKFYVRTQTAAMGVRGTEFETNYNPRNHITSLLTYKGEVAMVQTKGKEIEDEVQRQQEVEDVTRDGVEIKDAPKLAKTIKEEMELSLQSKEVVVVKQGQFSGTIISLNKTSLPVKVSPVQLNHLYANNEMVENKGRATRRTNVSLENKSFNLTPVEQEAPLEGFYDPKTGAYAPKAGGLLDMSSGLYISPGVDSVFDERNNIYVASNIGDIDKRTGQYVAPRGLKLDAEKGFVPLKFRKNPSAETLTKQLAMRDQMNIALRKDLHLRERVDKNKVIDFPKMLRLRELLGKHTVSVHFKPMSYSLEMSDDTLTAVETKYDSDNANSFLLNWSIRSGSTWQPVLSFGRQTIAFKENQVAGLSKGSDHLAQMGFGVRFNLSSRWNLVTMLSLEQTLYLNHEPGSSSTTEELIKVYLPRIPFTLEGLLIKWGTIGVHSDIGFVTNLAKKSGNFEVKPGFGLNFDLYLKWWVKAKYWASLGLSSHTFQSEVANTNFTATAKNSSTALNLGFGASF